jgi:hypothetical protein
LDAVRSALEREKGRIYLQFTERDDEQGIWHFHFEMILPAFSFITGPESELMTQQAS